MEAVPPAVSFGESLKDGFKPVNAWVAAGIAWLDDIQSFYRERAAIEKEYAGKLRALTAKYHDKKSKKSATLSVGDTPQMTPGSLESASLTTWTTILTTTEAVSAEHDALSVALTTQVADALKSIGSRYEDFRKRHETLAGKLVAERDSVYGELKKSKGEYDAECKIVEERRQKVDKSFDASRPKAQNKFRAEQLEMNNTKNAYLIRISVTNHHKKRFFYDDLPEVLNSLQDMNETRVAKVNALWTLGSKLETSCYEKSIGHLATQIYEITRNVPTLDSGMFVNHNLGAWDEPADFAFEPCPIWHDNPDMVVDEPAQVFLRNMLQKSKRKVQELKPDVETRTKEIIRTTQQRDAIKLDESQMQKDIDLMRALIYTQEEILPLAGKLLTAQVEIDTIVNTAGDLSRGSSAHNFKSTSFKIPTSCDLCGEKIWGLSSKGCTCTDCGFACHIKCEMKVPAKCPGVLDKAAKKAMKEEMRANLSANDKASISEVDLPELGRTSTVNSLSSSHQAGSSALGVRRMSKLGRSPSISTSSVHSNSSGVSKAPTPTPAAPRGRIMAPPPERYVSELPGDRAFVPEIATDKSLPSTPGPQERGKLLYAFNGDGENQLQVSEGSLVIILDDDGSWMTVRRSDGTEGIVPTTYIEKISPGRPSTPPRSPSPPPPRSPSPPPAGPPRLAPRPGRILEAPPPSRAGKRGPPPPVKPRGSKKKEPKVKALYAYEPQGDDEAEMEAGEEFVVIERDIGGWVKVKTRTGEGLVPGTYVEDV